MIARTVMPLLLIPALALGGCGGKFADMNREPAMTPIGSGLNPNRAPMAMETRVQAPRNGASFWQDASADLFRDPRATRVGDVVTVKISIKDKASLDNTTERTRNSSNNLGYDLKYNLNTPIVKGSGDGTIASNLDAKTTTKGEGTIARSESIDLLVAVVVTDVLPNGNLVISGSQEVRVNQEVRVLSVAGVLRPRDIATDNTVSYDKIAEARISYGGRGRITEIQQPGWGHQLVDLLAPF
ncbi:MAG TPA: flagellar basal body L-ring protein FlgH [Hyphomicrobiaceae bacterium]|nr:flagellar basal body L-ring protein FlgH [Hyphomicrobiaceae bacterium]